MTILVTGVTGLVGKRLLPRLIAAGHCCRVLIRRPSEMPDGVQSVVGDMLDNDTIAEAVEGVTAVIHLAAVFRTQDSGLIWRSNVDGTNALIACLKTAAPSARLIMASTSNVYDRDSDHPGTETDVVTPTLAYPASKIAAEQSVRESGMRWSIIRFPFVYGDGDGHLEMLPQHVGALGFHPAHRLSTIHHMDIATAMNMALAGVFDGKVINVADDAPTTILELMKLVGSEMPPSSAPLVDPWYLHVDASLARDLGFDPVMRSVHQAAREGRL